MSLEFTENPIGLQPSGASETKAKQKLVQVAALLNLEVTQGILDYTRRINTNALYVQLRNIQLRLVNGQPANVTKDLYRIAKKLNATLAAAS